MSNQRLFISEKNQNNVFGLTPRYLDFVFYFVHGEETKNNATKSALAAGYSEKAVTVTGHRVLKNANVQEAIRAEIEALHLSNHLTTMEGRANELKKMYDKVMAYLVDNEFKGIKPVATKDEVHEYIVLDIPSINTARAILDDIAKEVGGRTKTVDVTSKGEAVKAINIVYVNDWRGDLPAGGGDDSDG